MSFAHDGGSGPTASALAGAPDRLNLATDVLVIGGGLAGTWAAVAAREAGARVVLVDKGFCGTSGVTAPAGPGHWWLPPDPALRADAVARRHDAGLGLADADAMHRALDDTWRRLPTLAPWYDFPRDAGGQPHYKALRGPEYLRAMRARVLAAGATVIDHAPALELLRDADGAIAGARGLLRQPRPGLPAGSDWQVRAGAVVIATGGCAFRARLLGADTNTGDGYLMAAEAGAELSGMEFSSYHTVTPTWSSMTRAMSYAFARYFDADGHELDIPFSHDGMVALARALDAGPVTCSLDRMPESVREALPRISPNVLLSFDRAGVDPFRQRFEITLRGEGTVRGVGGLRHISADAETTVPGLYAAGDASSREPIAGAISGGGAQNSSWALSTGVRAGAAAARRALDPGREAGDRPSAGGTAGSAAAPVRAATPGHGPQADAPLTALGEAGLRTRTDARSGLSAAEAIELVRREILPFNQSLYRDGARLAGALARLDALWQELREHAGADRNRHDPAASLDRLRWREAAALVASARWCQGAALARRESRGLLVRDDLPAADTALAARLHTGGLDRRWTRLAA
ncbi:FAD-binding protein [Derxia gummosa]|uniref:FAD-binding protein n=1 Tax=Derxia gummosa DSM 723 TaxID=1121388 RepID=A0A8B6X9J9_9BURK|nr:FAD-binding protein [Derxia gummosa]